VAEKRACKLCQKPTGMADGYCRRTRECAAARQTALYNRTRGAFPLCLACGGPLRKRYGQLHTECHTHPRRILLARLAAGIAALETRGEAEREARRVLWRARYAARRAAGKTAEHAESVSLTERERELAGRAGSACPRCGRTCGPTGMCYQSAGCFDAGMLVVMPDYDPRRLYRVA
jgi:hypothetical protein